MAKGADCKSAGYAFVGSSPTSPTILIFLRFQFLCSTGYELRSLSISSQWRREGTSSVNEGHHHRGTHRAEVPRRDWRRIHHSPLFWLGVAMFITAIGIYVWSDDLAWRPHIEHH